MSRMGQPPGYWRDCPYVEGRHHSTSCEKVFRRFDVCGEEAEKPSRLSIGLPRRRNSPMPLTSSNFLVPFRVAMVMI